MIEVNRELAVRALTAGVMRKVAQRGLASLSAEERAHYDSVAGPPAAEPAPAFALAPEPFTGKLSGADQKRFETLYKKGWRTIYRWVERGEKSGEPCPLNEPAKMPGWWSRNMKWRVPEEVELAALQVAKTVAPAPAAAPPVTMQDPPRAPADPLAKGIRLEDYDPEEGDRLRELKQLQVAKFNELRDALAEGREATVLEGKYVKFCETLDKIESRVIERMKKRGLYVLREEVDRDLAGNAELLRQTRESMPRRVLELCPALTADQRIEVSAAITRAMRRDDSILARLDCLTTQDLLRELAADAA